jgi:hypothetical protein
MVPNIVRRIFSILWGNGPTRDQTKPEPNAKSTGNAAGLPVERLRQVEHHKPTAESVDKARTVDNTMQAIRTPVPEGIDHPDKRRVFLWILHLLRLVTTARLGFPVWKLPPGEARSYSRFNTKSYGYLDALTTLLLRRDEVVAAVESSPGTGVILSDDTEVHCHFLLYHLTQLTHIPVRRSGGSRIL